MTSRASTAIKTYRWAIISAGGSKLHSDARVYGLHPTIDYAQRYLPDGVEISHDKAYRNIRKQGIYAQPFQVKEGAPSLAKGSYVLLISLSESQPDRR